MRVVNPIGRNVETEVDANSLRACMCSGYSFADAQTTADTCSHCGCNCSTDQFSAGNYHTASGTYRTSEG